MATKTLRNAKEQLKGCRDSAARVGLAVTFEDRASREINGDGELWICDAMLDVVRPIVTGQRSNQLNYVPKPVFNNLP
jgi:hypothetical protein